MRGHIFTMQFDFTVIDTSPLHCFQAENIERTIPALTAVYLVIRSVPLGYT